MSKQLIKSLLSICQKKPEFIQHSKGMLDFCREYSIGEIQSTRIFFTVKDCSDIAMILEKEFGVDPQTRPDAWDGISRTEALKHGFNEKISSERVKSQRVCLKALPGRMLCVNGKRIDLPDGGHLDIPLAELLIGEEHQSILLIENWLNFEGTHNTPLFDSIDGNPLVLYRGDMEMSIGDSTKLMERAGLPVYAFVDYDPKGLIIAKSLPNFVDMIIPDLDVLDAMVKGAGNYDRFLIQKAASPKVLMEIKHPTLKAVWNILDEHANALPQETLIEL